MRLWTLGGAPTGRAALCEGVRAENPVEWQKEKMGFAADGKQAAVLGTREQAGDSELLAEVGEVHGDGAQDGASRAAHDGQFGAGGEPDGAADPGATLPRELAEMEVRATPSGREQYAACRSGLHRDLVFAVALAC